MPQRLHQRGLVGIVIVVTLVLLAGFALIQMQGRNIIFQSSRNSEALIPFTRIQFALLDFARINKRLPCPAKPSDDTGDPQPNSPTPVCNNSNGTVPFSVLGLSLNDVLDPWGRKISYRVISGPQSATVFEGLDRSQCIDPIIASNNPPDSTTQLCLKPAPLSRRTTFTNLVSIPSLTVTDNFSPASGVVYVLISHGETGRGAYLPGGQQLQPLPLAGSDEKLNTGTGNYVRSTPNTTMDVNQVGFFDDIVVYEKLQNLIDKAGLKARQWPDVPQ